MLNIGPLEAANRQITITPRTITITD